MATDIEIVGQLARELNVDAVKRPFKTVFWESSGPILWYETNSGGRVTKLKVGRLKARAVPPDVFRLEALEELSFQESRLRTLSPDIARLKNLTVLDLGDNQLSELPEAIGNLNHLCHVRLSINKLKRLPVSLVQLKSLRTLETRDNPLEQPPREICQNSLAAMRSYFEQQRQHGNARLFEAKVLIVGEPGAGKTSLTKKLLNPQCDLDAKEDSTLGIRVHTGWTFRCPGKPDTEFKANLWDFGGQEIQYMTHQYFLSGRSLYLLVADDRKQRTNFYYWFKVIRLLGRDKTDGTCSPVIAVLNERDGNKVTNFDLPEMRRQFPELPIECVNLDLSAKGAAMAALVERVQETASGLPHVGQELPAPWIPIRSALDDDKRPHIDYAEYLRICRSEGLGDRFHCETLSQYLNDLGVILHYPEDPRLRNLVILKASWLLDAIYAVLSSKELLKQEGRFRREWIYDVWRQAGYQDHESSDILALMSRDHFEICYPLPHTDDEFIAPQLLCSTRPGPDWDGRDNLELQYVYRFLPAGVITRLIVRRHEDIAAKGDVPLVWKTGVVLESSGAWAEVIQDKVDDGGMESIRVRVRGAPAARLSLLMLVRDEIERIHDKSFPDICVERRIPCGCEREGLGEGPTKFFSLDELEQWLGHSRGTVACPRCNRDRPILELLEGVHAPLNTGEALERVGELPDRQDVSEFVTYLERLFVAAGHLNFMPSYSNIANPIVSATADAKADVEVDVEITMEVRNNISALQGEFQQVLAATLDEAEELPELDRKRLQRDVNRAEKALAQLEAGSSQDEIRKSGALQTVNSFIQDLADTSTRAGKAFELVQNNAKKLQGLARAYNKLASWMMLPTVPEVLAGKDD